MAIGYAAQKEQVCRVFGRALFIADGFKYMNYITRHRMQMFYGHLNMHVSLELLCLRVNSIDIPCMYCTCILHTAYVNIVHNGHVFYTYSIE